MSIATDTWQLLFVDLLFLCLAGCLGLWFRSWLRGEKEAMGGRLEALEAQQAQLERISGRLQRIVRILEMQSRLESRQGKRRDDSVAGRRVPAGVRASGDAVGGSDAKEVSYEQAWGLLAKGLQPAEIARQLDLGIAEVELMDRMRRHKESR